MPPKPRPAFQIEGSDDASVIEKCFNFYKDYEKSRSSLTKNTADGIFEIIIQNLKKDAFLSDNYFEKIIKVLGQFNFPEKFIKIADALSESKNSKSRIYAYRIYKMAILEDFEGKDQARNKMFASNLESVLRSYFEGNKEKLEGTATEHLKTIGSERFFSKFIEYKNIDSKTGQLVINALINQIANPKIDPAVKEFLDDFIQRTLAEACAIDIALEKRKLGQEKEMEETRRFLRLEKIVKDYSSALVSVGSAAGIGEIEKIKKNFTAIRKKENTVNIHRMVDDLSQKIQILRALHEEDFEIDFSHLTINTEKLERASGYILGTFWINYILRFNQGLDIDGAYITSAIEDISRYLKKAIGQYSYATVNLGTDSQFLLALKNAQEKKYSSANQVYNAEEDIDNLAKQEFCEFFVNPEADLTDQDLQKLIDKAKVFLTNQDQQIILHPLRVVYSTNLALLAARVFENGVESKNYPQKKDRDLALKFLQYAARFDAKTAARLAVSYDPEKKPEINHVLYVAKDQKLAEKYYQQFRDLCGKNIALRKRFPDAEKAMPEKISKDMSALLNSIESYDDKKSVRAAIINFAQEQQEKNPTIAKVAYAQIAKSTDAELRNFTAGKIEKPNVATAPEPLPTQVASVVAKDSAQIMQDPNAIELENSEIVKTARKNLDNIDNLLDSLIGLISERASHLEIAQEVREIIRKCCLDKNSKITIKIDGALFSFENLADDKKEAKYQSYLASLKNPKQTVNEHVLNLILEDCAAKLKQIIIIKDNGKIEQSAAEKLISAISQEGSLLRKNLNATREKIIAAIKSDQARIRAAEQEKIKAQQDIENCAAEIAAMSSLIEKTTNAFQNFQFGDLEPMQSVADKIRSGIIGEIEKQKKEIADFLENSQTINNFADFPQAFQNLTRSLFQNADIVNIKIHAGTLFSRRAHLRQNFNFELALKDLEKKSAAAIEKFCAEKFRADKIKIARTEDGKIYHVEIEDKRGFKISIYSQNDMLRTNGSWACSREQQILLTPTESGVKLQKAPAGFFLNKDATNLASRLAFLYTIGIVTAKDLNFNDEFKQKIQAELAEEGQNISVFIRRDAHKYQLSQPELAKFSCALLLMAAKTKSSGFFQNLQLEILKQNWTNQEARTEITNFLYGEISILKNNLANNKHLTAQNRVDLLSQILLLAPAKNYDAQQEIGELKNLLQQNQDIAPRPLVMGADVDEFSKSIKALLEKPSAVLSQPQSTRAQREEESVNFI